jgi:chromosome segregation ATPase
MNESFINSLDEVTGRYVQEALNDDDSGNGLEEQFVGIQQQVSQVAEEIKSSAEAADALVFTESLRGFLSVSRERALRLQKLDLDIEQKEGQVSETQKEIQQLSTSLPAFGEVMRRALSEYEAARYEYNTQEFKIASLDNRLVMRRSELASLRRQLKELSKR